MLFLKIVLKLINLEERVAFFIFLFFLVWINSFSPKSFCRVIRGEESVTASDAA